MSNIEVVIDRAFSGGKSELKYPVSIDWELVLNVSWFIGDKF